MYLRPRVDVRLFARALASIRPEGMHFLYFVKKIDNHATLAKVREDWSLRSESGDNRMNLEQILDSIRQAKLFSRHPVFSRDHVATFEKSMAFSFPEGYVRLVTELEPELANFYFVEPHRHGTRSDLIVFARWNEDEFAFPQSGSGVTTVLQNRESGKSWGSFEDWLLYVWAMSNRPVNPE